MATFLEYRRNLQTTENGGFNVEVYNSSNIVQMVVVFVIRYAIRSAKSGHPAVGQSLDRLVQR